MTLETIKTEVGNYFISNYPPFSTWTRQGVAEAQQAFQSPPQEVPLGLYLHIPFCRKRCKFCYFRVYTDKRADEIETYLAALSKEIELIARLPCVGHRSLRFAYFGGGTPSFLSVKQLQSLVGRLRANVQWDQAEEVTFECEPGTLSQPKVHAIRDMGVTRLSLGVENFSDKILEDNGRAHLSKEVDLAWDWIKEASFPSVNIDLIAGMVGETWENWEACVQRTIAMAPDSVTIYQMELPYNTVYSKDVLGKQVETPVADWPLKRAWVEYAFHELEQIGYEVSSAYTMVRNRQKVRFRYRDHVWQGSDLLASGVASFGHISGVHYQNATEWQDYVDTLDREELPLVRALKITPRQALIREMVLQLKRGYLDVNAFLAKFAVNILEEWQPEWEQLRESGFVVLGDRIELTRAGLLCVDALLPRFFESAHRTIRYS
jgi:oxygen-independent coproporphyrinogen III oxidase